MNPQLKVALLQKLHDRSQNLKYILLDLHIFLICLLMLVYHHNYYLFQKPVHLDLHLEYLQFQQLGLA